MNSAITFITNSAGIYVAVPYALKDFTKGRFPSAKWQPALKKWRLEDTPRFRSRLEAAIKELSDTTAFQAALAQQASIKPFSVVDEIDFLEDVNPAAAQCLRSNYEYNHGRDW